MDITISGGSAGRKTLQGMGEKTVESAGKPGGARQ